MKQEFNEIEVGSRILLTLNDGSKDTEMGATIARHLKDNIALITLDNNNGQTIKFENVTINTIYTTPDGIPYIWMNSTIVYYQGQYLLQVKTNSGERHLCHNNFRVGVAHNARLCIVGHSETEVVLHDISLTGFSIIDSTKALDLTEGTHVLLRYEDIGYKLELEGNLVRIEKNDESIIFSFIITKANRELSSYVNLKQKRT